MEGGQLERPARVLALAGELDPGLCCSLPRQPRGTVAGRT